ncbi:MAG: ATP synthase F1 subunit gamma [Clostridiales bacterium]|jgi:F-type H+-transporting ATPase subunit gamma|nr:ATP synthase F1 subunit gamma [Clostridiales bacterium]
MKSLIDIKHRIKSVADTRQITYAMETVSIAKMRKAMRRFETGRLFFETIKNAIDDVVLKSGDVSSVYFGEEKSGDTRDIYIVIASDKGLAGGFNHNVLKFAWGMIEGRKNCNVFTVGQVAREFFEKRGVTVDIEFSGAGYDPGKSDSAAIADAVINLYKAGGVDGIYIVYTKMLSSTSMRPDRIKLLPFSRGEALKRLDALDAQKEYVLSEIEYDPSPDAVLKKLVPQYLRWLIYGALIQSSASEHCSRRNAMSNATKNASEILDELKIEYNEARQESITNELSEIITASGAVNGAGV